MMSLFFFIRCTSQNIKIKDYTNTAEMSYFFARINPTNIITKELYDRGLYIKVFEISDSKATPENSFDETDEFLSSYIISIVPDGDYYTSSKLYKLEGLLNPKIIEIRKEIYPNFLIIIESGTFKTKKIETFKFNGLN